MMDFIKMKLEDVTKTSRGSIYQIYKDRYWAVKDGNIFFYRTYCSPQCNSQLEIMRTSPLVKNHGADIKKIDVVFVPHSCSDFI